jgi:signal transduction histidine kinase
MQQNFYEKKGNGMNAMEMEELRQMLLKAFEATFTEELLPGILHNFANPLNGIMGRAQILQRRLNDTIAKMSDQYPAAAAAFLEPHKKLVSDVATICQESDRFYNMFQDVSGKFYAIGATAPGLFDISGLLASELRFADYYLDFKHAVIKELDFESSLPEIYGISSYYALSFWSLFRHAMVRMKTGAEKTLYVSTSREDAQVVVRLRFHGLSLNEDENQMIEQAASGQACTSADADRCANHLYWSLSLLRQLGAQVDFQDQEGYHEIVIRVSY